MEDIRIAIVGLGERAVYGWIGLLQAVAGYRITALCDPIAGLHARALAQLADPRGVNVSTRYEDVLADPGVDAVALCIRGQEVGALAAQALEAGKHVNSEVPGAASLQDCWRIVVAAERSGCVYQLAEQVRYSGHLQAWRKMVAQGQLGRITYCEGEYFHYYPLKNFQDPHSGEFFRPEEMAAHPQARATWWNHCPAMIYTMHNLGPILMVLDDRVTEVVGMSTRTPSYVHPEVESADVQAALMKTEQDTIVRVAASFGQPYPEANHHRFRFVGTLGSVEWKRAGHEMPLEWLAGTQMADWAAVDWRYQRTDAPREARRSGHGGTDYYVHAAFRDAVWGVRPLEYDVYAAMDTTAPGILAAESIAQGSRPLRVPSFRPGASRPSGTMQAP